MTLTRQRILCKKNFVVVPPSSRNTRLTKPINLDKCFACCLKVIVSCLFTGGKCQDKSTPHHTTNFPTAHTTAVFNQQHKHYLHCTCRDAATLHETPEAQLLCFYANCFLNTNANCLPLALAPSVFRVKSDQITHSVCGVKWHNRATSWQPIRLHSSKSQPTIETLANSNDSIGFFAILNLFVCCSLLPLWRIGLQFAYYRWLK